MFTEPYISNVTIFAGNFAPTGWLFCQGQSLPISGYEVLYTLIGTTYGGDGIINFNLPDMRGRVAVHAGQGPGLSPYIVGQAGGTETIVLTLAQLAAHNHIVTTEPVAAPPCSSLVGTTDDPTGNLPAQVNGAPASYSTAPGTNAQGGACTALAQSTATAGGNSPVTIIPPYVAMNYIICTAGIFPSRN